MTLALVLESSLYTRTLIGSVDEFGWPVTRQMLPGNVLARGTDIMANVAASTSLPASRLVGQHDRPSMVSVGTIVWLSSELMFFAALFACYFTIRSVSPDLWAIETTKLNVPFAAFNTTVLVLSSVTCQMGVFAAERGEVSRTGSLANPLTWGLREWFILTYAMGSFFVAGQIFEYSELVRENITIPASPYGSIFYLATGFHALHVTGGLIAFLFVLGRTYMARRFTHEHAITAIVVSYYWHFVDIVWVALFTSIYLIK
jgi:cytochrome c oxidase subunit III